MSRARFVECPYCEARVPRGVLACPECGSDAETGWQEGEGGLAQATQHLTLMKRGEGLEG